MRSGIRNVLQALTDAESAQRGHVLTGDRVFVDQVVQARARAQDELKAVTELTVDNPEQQARLGTLRAQTAVRLQVIDQTLAARAAGAPVAAIRIIRQGRGIAAMGEIRRLVAELDSAEARLEGQRTDRAAQKLYDQLGVRSLFVSGSITDEFRKAMAGINLIGFLGKPVTRRTLGDALAGVH